MCMANVIVHLGIGMLALLHIVLQEIVNKSQCLNLLHFFVFCQKNTALANHELVNLIVLEG